MHLSPIASREGQNVSLDLSNLMGFSRPGIPGGGHRGASDITWWGHRGTSISDSSPDAQQERGRQAGPGDHTQKVMHVMVNL